MLFGKQNKSRINFDKISEEVTSKFFNEAVPLTDGVMDVAEREQMNPEEIKRTIEKSNTLAVLKLLKTNKDKKAEIDLADYDAVIAKTHGSDDMPKNESSSKSQSDGQKIATKTASHSIPHMRNKNHDGIDLFNAFGLDRASLAKHASDESQKTLKDIFALKKEINELKHEKFAYEMAVYDNIDYLVSEFSNLNGPDFHKYANESYTMFGNSIKPILNTVANNVKENEPELVKVAYVVDDRTDLHTKTATIYDSLNSIIEVDQKLVQKQNDLETTWQSQKQAQN